MATPSLDLSFQGVMPYYDHYPNDKEVRLVINIYIADYLKPVSAIVDTGAPWCVLNPFIFEQVLDYAEPIYELGTPLHIRGMRYPGGLYQLPIHLEPFHGDGLDVMGTVFVPRLRHGEDWYYPNFIGLNGFLNRIRFAIDSTHNLFFFGR